MNRTMRSMFERKKNKNTSAPMELATITQAASFISLTV